MQTDRPWRFVCDWRGLAVLLAVLMLGAPARVRGQEAPALPASLVEAIGRLVTGIGVQATVFVAYCLEPPEIVGAFVDQAAARLAVDGRSGCGELAVGTPAQSERVLTTSLMRRIAEAADGYRTGDTVWIVADEVFPHNVSGVFFSLAEALEILGPGEVVEPVLTQTDSGLDRVIVPMEHLPDSECTFDDPNCCDRYLGGDCPWEIDALVRVEDVDSTVVQFFAGDSLALRMLYAPTGPDALFFTLSAVDKFYLPYLTRIYGVDYAASFRVQYVAIMRRLLGAR